MPLLPALNHYLTILDAVLTAPNNQAARKLEPLLNAAEARLRLLAQLHESHVN